MFDDVCACPYDHGEDDGDDHWYFLKVCVYAHHEYFYVFFSCPPDDALHHAYDVSYHRLETGGHLLYADEYLQHTKNDLPTSHIKDQKVPSHVEAKLAVVLRIKI